MFGVQYSAYRFAIVVLGLAVLIAAHLLIHGTKAGMLVRAGASNPQIVGALGINIKVLNAALFTLRPRSQAWQVALPRRSFRCSSGWERTS